MAWHACMWLALLYIARHSRTQHILQLMLTAMVSFGRNAFLSKHGEAVQNAVAYEMNKAFLPVLHEKMNYYSNDPKAGMQSFAENVLGRILCVCVRACLHVCACVFMYVLYFDET